MRRVTLIFWNPNDGPHDGAAPSTQVIPFLKPSSLSFLQNEHEEVYTAAPWQGTAVVKVVEVKESVETE